jgi:hypothetical protein
MSSIQDHPRWFELSDGVSTVVANIYDALDFNQSYEPFGGSSVIRMMNGSALKQVNWEKIRTSISGSGGLPFGFSSLDYKRVLTLKCAVPRSIVQPTNSFTLPTNRRTDAGYEPVTLKLVEGFWLPVTSVGVASAYKLMYYPEIQCFADPPQESTNPDSNPPTSWSFVAEEI